jgi:hypothetical protein
MHAKHLEPMPGTSEVLNYTSYYYQKLIFDGPEEVKFCQRENKGLGVAPP